MDEHAGQKDALSEGEKMLLGLPYNAMQDMDLVRRRLRARKYLKAYNVRSIHHYNKQNVDKQLFQGLYTS